MTDQVVQFQTGEPIARVGRANGGLIQRDMRKAALARDVLREIPIHELIDRVGKASMPSIRDVNGQHPAVRLSHER